jgi:RNA polymerase sigma-70 factor (sigma-E family)
VTAGFVEFAAARSSALHRYAYLLVGDLGHAEDLVQEALTRTYVNWTRLRDPRSAEAYTRKAITSIALDWRRRRSWTERPRDDLPDQIARGEPTDGVTTRDWVWRELQALPPRQRAAVVLRYYENLTLAQTAEVMGCTIGTVKSQVSHGLKRLQATLGDQVTFKETTTS